jgi:NAD(P)-dependent dehydrogenase (short-subunit alcohol dehydrogenase family)
MTISFKDKVAIVTGAGGGLGKAYALELARRGAKVVVNDLGGSRDGTGTSDAAAQVVAEIEAMGGEAIANGGSVTEFEQMEKMVADAKQKWGGVHVLINNAGVLRDKTFIKMEPTDFEFVVKVHLTGSAFATKAAWETMREQGYGRILMTASSTGLFGNFGQANYGAAKLGLKTCSPKKPSSCSRRKTWCLPRCSSSAKTRRPTPSLARARAASTPRGR